MSAKTEKQVFTEIESSLTAKFADLPPARVTTIIEDARDQFAGSTIRDFVPLLVERRAGEELSGTRRRDRLQRALDFTQRALQLGRQGESDRSLQIGLHRQLADIHELQGDTARFQPFDRASRYAGFFCQRSLGHVARQPQIGQGGRG